MKTFLMGAISAILLLSSGTSLYSQKKSEATPTRSDIEYREESEAFRKSVWSWKKPEFSNRVIPAEFANASKVVMARHTELTADSKNKIATYGLGVGTKKELTIIETVREMVKLNDKSAVEEYSELSFTRMVKKSGVYRQERSTAFVGVRVIKPNGKVKEINADDIVFTKDEAAEKKAKVAIPDLQPGDIIDYFIATDQYLTNDISVKSYSIFLFDDAPVLHYSFHGELGRKYAIDYRSYNGAPDLKVSKNGDEDIIIDVVKKNIPAFETSLWIAPALQLPFIRMQISLGYKGLASGYAGLNKPGDVNKDKEAKEVLARAAKSFLEQKTLEHYASRDKDDYILIVNDTKNRARQNGLNFKEMTDVEKATDLYYTMRFSKLLKFDMKEFERTINIGQYRFNGLALVLSIFFDQANLKPMVLLSTPRNGYRMKEVMATDDFETAAYLKENNKIFSIQSVYSIPFSAPAEFEGAKNLNAMDIDAAKSVLTPEKAFKSIEVLQGSKIPESDPGKNAHLENLMIALAPGKDALSIKRKTVLKGHNKYDVQKDLILYEDFYESERKALGVKKTLIESLEDNRKSKKLVEDVKNALAEARNKQVDAFKEEAKNWFEQEISNLKDFKVEKMGVRHTDPDFVYSSSFNLNGLIKKAGNNLIVEIGKIQGTPLSIKPEQRNRTMDIYMDYPRSIEYQINFQIPAGYTAQGVEALNKKVVNETGFFTAEASLEGSNISIKIKKHYLHYFEPAANWAKMTEFLDAAVEWTNAKILLKKI